MFRNSAVGAALTNMRLEPAEAGRLKPLALYSLLCLHSQLSDCLNEALKPSYKQTHAYMSIQNMHRGLQQRPVFSVTRASRANLDQRETLVLMDRKEQRLRFY